MGGGNKPPKVYSCFSSMIPHTEKTPASIFDSLVRSEDTSISNCRKSLLFLKQIAQILGRQCHL